MDTYDAVVERGLTWWGARIRMMARREGLIPSADTQSYPACRQDVTADHLVEGCPWRHRFRRAMHSKLHMLLETFCTRWKRRAVTEEGGSWPSAGHMLAL